MVYLFQASVLSSREIAKYWPILARFGQFVAYLRTFWCNFYKPKKCSGVFKMDKYQVSMLVCIPYSICSRFYVAVITIRKKAYLKAVMQTKPISVKAFALTKQMPDNIIRKLLCNFIKSKLLYEKIKLKGLKQCTRLCEFSLNGNPILFSTVCYPS